MNGGSFLFYWLTNRVQSIAAVYGLFGSIFTLLTTILAITVLLVVALIPLYINESSSQPLGELYCINNYSMIVGFQIPQYNTLFGVTLTSATYTISSGTTFTPSVASCGGPINITTSENIAVTDTCTFGLLSIIYPAVPNAPVFENYALGEACYRTLQSCHYDPLLTACILTNCIAVSSTDPTTNGSYPLTNYRVRCAANIYYKARCTDAAVSSRLFYSASQPNSACRRQRLNRINSCFNSTVQLSNVPSLISVSSGIVTTTTATCTQTGATNTVNINIADGPVNNSISATASALGGALGTAFTSPTFAASDQTNGHVYRITSVNSEIYPSTQLGALYCGSATSTQIAASITAAINSQNSP